MPNNSNWILPNWPAPPVVKALSTLRTGGVSVGSYSSFNFGNYAGDDPEKVFANRQILREKAKLPSEPYWLRQEHGIEAINLADLEADNSNHQNLIADASYSFQPNKVCVVTTADCLPILLCNAQGTAVAAVHAGWRGLARGVIEACFQSLGCSADQLLVWLGPGIGKEVFEVGDDVREIYTLPEDEKAFVRFGEKWKLDLYLAATFRLHRLGIRQIFGGGFCTYTEKERFFSYRREAKSGRMATLIWLQ